MHHPWRAFRHETDWTLRLDLMPAGVAGVTCWETMTVTLDVHLLQAERRCTIAHEMEHIRRGPPPDDPLLAEREESAVEQAAARRLISLADLGEALAWARSLSEAAEELWVDPPTLQTRLDHLHPSEHAYLTRRLEHHD